jgi:hypothetical protein
MRRRMIERVDHEPESVCAIFGPKGGVDLQLPSRSTVAERPPPDFSGDEYGS